MQYKRFCSFFPPAVKSHLYNKYGKSLRWYNFSFPWRIKAIYYVKKFLIEASNLEDNEGFKILFNQCKLLSLFIPKNMCFIKAALCYQSSPLFPTFSASAVVSTVLLLLDIGNSKKQCDHRFGLILLLCVSPCVSVLDIWSHSTN